MIDKLCNIGIGIIMVQLVLIICVLGMWHGQNQRDINLENGCDVDLTPVLVHLRRISDRIERLEMEQGLEPMPYQGQYGGRWNEAD